MRIEAQNETRRALEQALDEIDRPVVSAVEVAERLDVNRVSTVNRLEYLVENGDVETSKVGKSRVWWLST